MCGILGYWGDIDEQAFELAFKALAHRGPDGAGQFRHEKLRLTHHRLAIQDVSDRAAQPMLSPSGRFVLVFNGEIYNHLELRRTKLSEVDFKSTSDTETILAGWEKYGQEWIKELNGMFAFALLDKQEHSLFLVRDPNGIKPLFYFLEEECFGFASEMPALLAIRKGELSLSSEALRNYALFLFAPGGKTPIEKIQALPPGAVLALPLSGSLGKVEPQSYAPAPAFLPKRPESFSVLTKQFHDTFFAAVNRQLLADVPVAFLLSGGLDSASIMPAVRAMHPHRALTAFTLHSKDLTLSEGLVDDLHYARLVAKQLNVSLVEVEAEVDPNLAFDPMIKTLGLPIADAAAIHLDILCAAAAKQGYKVLIGGWGGDELLSGYRRHQMVKYARILNWIGPISGPIHWLGKAIPHSTPFFRRVKKAMLSVGPTKRQSLLNLFAWLPELEVEALFSEKCRKQFKATPFDFFTQQEAYLPENLGDLDRLLHWDWTSYLVDNNLHYVDAMSMKHGVEIRVPFLDHELVAFARTLPEALKMKGSTTKYILRKSMEAYLPHEVIYRPKTGFGGPVRKWINEELKTKMEDYLSEESIKKRGIFDFYEVQKLVEDNRNGLRDAAYTIWELLAIEAWCRQQEKLEIRR